jgi:hypothetical protein
VRAYTPESHILIFLNCIPVPGKAAITVMDQSVKQSISGSNQTMQGSAVKCEACPSGYYQNRSDSKPEFCSPCPIGSFANEIGSHLCLLCPSETCQNESASNSCKPCPWWDTLCGGSVCSVDSLAENRAEIVFMVLLPTSKLIFLSAQDKFLDAMSLLLSIRRSQIRVSDLRDFSFDRRASSAVQATIDAVMSSASCSKAQSLLTGSNINLTMKSVGLPGISSFSASYNGCDESNNQSAQADTLTIELKQQITSTTIVVASVVSVVVSGSVAGAVAGSLGVAISSTGAMPGASVYQLIDSVQFLNIYGSMFKTAGTNDALKSARRAYISNESDEELNATASKAAGFR